MRVRWANGGSGARVAEGCGPASAEKIRLSMHPGGGTLMVGCPAFFLFFSEGVCRATLDLFDSSPQQREVENGEREKRGFDSFS